MKLKKLKKVTIIGTGLMGASIGLAIKKENLVELLVGVDKSEEILKQAKEIGAIDDFKLELKEGCKGAEMIILATSVQLIIKLLPKAAKCCPDGAIVTDVGSTKREIVRIADECFPEGKFFVGSHPMSGSEKSGPKSATPELFKESCCYVTIGEKTSYEATAKVILFWKSIGMNPVIIRPDRHDQLVSRTSHLPHLSSVALSLAFERLSSEDVNFLKKIAGKGLRLATRTAESPSELWIGISQTNKDNILTALSALKDEIENLMMNIKNEDFKSLKERLEKAKKFRAILNE